MCVFEFVFFMFIHISFFFSIVQLTSTSGTFEGFMVETRERTEEESTPTEEAFDIGSTIWGTWVTDQSQLGSGFDPSMDLLYHTVECNRSLTSSEGPFEVRYYCRL